MPSRPSHMPASACPAEPVVALVLGAAVWPGGEPSPTLRRRACHAATLFAQGHVSHILGCGGLGRHGPSEAEVIGRLCAEAGVPGDRIAREDGSANTFQNLAFSLPHLRRLGTRRVAIVTDGYHLPRARLVARRLGLQTVDLPGPPPAPASARRLRSALREIPAYLWYLTGIPLRPAPDRDSSAHLR